MAIRTRSAARRDHASPGVNGQGFPILYEDEDEGDMGESNPHVENDEIFHVCVKAHLAATPELQVFSNMNLYYLDGPRHPRTGSLPYVSPDNMVVRPYRRLPETITSYTIGKHGPAPLLTGEILSERSAQQRDLDEKMTVYALLKVPEYILVDPSGRYLKHPLLLKRLQRSGTYKDERDADGGVTSRLGFRLIIDGDGKLRVFNVRTGRRYVRPDEAQSEFDARRKAEERIKALEEELARLRGRKKKR
jgi:Uma2 family endonuclease